MIDSVPPITRIPPVLFGALATSEQEFENSFHFEMNVDPKLVPEAASIHDAGYPIMHPAREGASLRAQQQHFVGGTNNRSLLELQLQEQHRFEKLTSLGESVWRGWCRSERAPRLL